MKLPCSHCGLPTPVENQQQEFIFCCAGCRGAYSFIHELGLEHFYDLQTESAPPARVGAIDPRGIEIMAQEAKAISEDCCELKLGIDGLHCAACVWLLEKLPGRIDGWYSSRVSMTDQSIRLQFDPRRVPLAKIADSIQQLGYTLSLWAPPSERRQYDAIRRKHWTGIATAFFFAANSMWIGIALYAGESTGMAEDHANFLRWVGAILGALSAIIPGRIFFETAWQAIRTRTAHVDIPVALALGVGSISSIVGAARGDSEIYFDSMASLVLLLRAGRYLQFRAQYKAGSYLHRLFHASSDFATRVDHDGTIGLVKSREIQPRDHLRIQVGETIPVDGRLLQHRSSINSAWLTGESTPMEVGPGDPVLAGCVNVGQTFDMEADSAFDQSRLARLQELVHHAASQKTPLVQLADRAGAWFVLAVLALATVTFAGWSYFGSIDLAVRNTVALLTIACPCALALAAPLVITVAIGEAAKRGIWIRDGSIFESLVRPGQIWFDKTGTLTSGTPTVKKWNGGLKPLRQAAFLAEGSSHPYSQAVKRFLEDKDPHWKHENRGQPVTSEYVIGRGLHGNVGDQHVALGSYDWMMDQNIEVRPQDLLSSFDYLSRGSSPLFVAVNRSTRGVFEILDNVRSDAHVTIQILQKLGWKVGILSGDRVPVVKSVAHNLHIESCDDEQFRGAMTPEMKLQQIADSQQAGLNTMMVGDGINDAAALMLADIGIAIRNEDLRGLDTAPVSIPQDRLSVLIDLIVASHRSVRSIHRCFAASILYNSVMIGLAMAGKMHPLFAAILMPVSGLTVIAMAIQTRSFSRVKGSDNQNRRHRTSPTQSAKHTQPPRESPDSERMITSETNPAQPPHSRPYPETFSSPDRES